jgi:hypothetical protein
VNYGVIQLYLVEFVILRQTSLYRQNITEVTSPWLLASKLLMKSKKCVLLVA